jgi:hypothetical protein
MLAFLLAALSCLWLVACGGTSKAADGPAAGAGLARFSDKDYDRTSNAYYDPDDAEVVSYGKPADASDMRAVTQLLTRYYAASAAGDGATGCSLAYPLFAEGLVEDYGSDSGPPTVGHKTCPEVMSKLFKLHHAELARAAAHLKVTAVSVRGERAYAMLDTGASYPESFFVHRQGGVWKVEALVGSELS